MWVRSPGKRCSLDPWVRKIHWSGKGHPTPVFLPGKFPGQRSLAGCCPWGCKESDPTEHMHTHTSHHLTHLFWEPGSHTHQFHCMLLWELLMGLGRCCIKHVVYRIIPSLPIRIFGERTENSEIGRRVNSDPYVGS